MSTILAIDPGNHESAYTLIDHDQRPLQIGKVPNDELATELLPMLSWSADLIAIEQIGHYGTGMPAGRDVFDTCRWIGRFEQIILNETDIIPELVLRAKVKTHLCGVAKAKDGNVSQALVDRFTPGQPNRGKGTKTVPGWFHGFARDIWQAYALAVYVADTRTVVPA